jgi:hypothetical protein
MSHRLLMNVCAAIGLAGMNQLAFSSQAASADAIASMDKSPSQVIGLYVFGKKNQSESTQLADEKTCFRSAKTASGYDQAMAAAAAPSQPQAQPKGGRVRGAVGGAIAGTAIGSVAGDTGKGAAIGATAGVLSGGAQQREARRAQAAQAVQEQEKKKAAALAELKRAFGACMDAKDYSVK